MSRGKPGRSHAFEFGISTPIDTERGRSKSEDRPYLPREWPVISSFSKYIFRY